MIENYQFRGYSFQELVECFGLEQKHVIYGKRNGADIDDSFNLEFRPLVAEEVEKVFYVNGNKVVFILTDQEEVELEKLRQFLWENNSNAKVVAKVRLFMEALIEESEKSDYNYPAFNGILKIENDEDFVHWVIHNLEHLWT